jgi:hypothetical protein
MKLSPPFPLFTMTCGRMSYPHVGDDHRRSHVRSAMCPKSLRKLESSSYQVNSRSFAISVRMLWKQEIKQFGSAFRGGGVGIWGQICDRSHRNLLITKVGKKKTWYGNELWKDIFLTLTARAFLTVILTSHWLYFMKPAFPSPLESTLGFNLSISDGLVPVVVLESPLLPYPCSPDWVP